jgi:hypothetical protein
MDCNLPLTGLPFLERFNDYVGGISIDMDVIIRTDINACDYYEPIPPTPTPSCTVTTQYLEVDLGGCANFSLKLWEDSGFTNPTTALCNYVISGVCTGDMGTIYYGTETITTGQHTHNFNLNPVLQQGECISTFDVLSYSASTCVCPVNLILP